MAESIQGSVVSNIASPAGPTRAFRANRPSPQPIRAVPTQSRAYEAVGVRPKSPSQRRPKDRPARP